MTCPGNDDVRNVCSGLVTRFSVVLPERLRAFCAPSLSLLARHYVDPIEEVQQAARALMEGTLMRMKPEVRAQIVAAWTPRVTRLAATSEPVDLTSPKGVSVVILALLASRFATPVQPRVSAELVRHLIALLDHPTTLHRIAAAELLGNGYAMWKSHVIEPPALIRTLFRLATAGGSDDGASDSAPRGLIRTGSTSDAEVEAETLAVASTDEATLAHNHFYASLLSVSVCEPRHFCEVMGENAVQMSARHGARIAAVSALISLFKTRGVSLEAELPAAVHAVLRPLDPSVPSLREGCLRASTTALRELVKRYPMMAFHQASQRLAVGTAEGVVIIYDLRTATKWRILQGHVRPVSAVAFSLTGEHLASVSATERSLRFWIAGAQGFFGFLGLQGSCLHDQFIEALPAADTNPAVGLEWTSPSTVLLSCNCCPISSYSKP
jgi:hypothetical protein